MIVKPRLDTLIVIGIVGRMISYICLYQFIIVWYLEIRKLATCRISSLSSFASWLFSLLYCSSRPAFPNSPRCDVLLAWNVTHHIYISNGLDCVNRKSRLECQLWQISPTLQCNVSHLYQVDERCHHGLLLACEAKEVHIKCIGQSNICNSRATMM